MPFDDLEIENIVLMHNGTGFVMPFVADRTDTWHIVLDDDTTETFDVIEGLPIVLPEDIFENSAINFYKILREDYTIFRNRQYQTYVNYEAGIVPTESTVSIVGKIHFVTDEETKLSYSNSAFVGLKEWFVIWENQLIYPDYEVDPVSNVGTFTWTLEEDQSIFIMYFK